MIREQLAHAMATTVQTRIIRWIAHNLPANYKVTAWIRDYDQHVEIEIQRYRNGRWVGLHGALPASAGDEDIDEVMTVAVETLSQN